MFPSGVLSSRWPSWGVCDTPVSHPSVVSLLGVSIQPRAIVLELAPLGSMATVLKGKSPLDKMVQHRIALQVLCYWWCWLWGCSVVYKLLINVLKIHNNTNFSIIYLSWILNDLEFCLISYSNILSLKNFFTNFVFPAFQILSKLDNFHENQWYLVWTEYTVSCFW